MAQIGIRKTVAKGFDEVLARVPEVLQAEGFGILTRKSVRRGSFETVRALIRHIDQYIAHWNDHPTPFVWTKTPADIIAKAVRRGR